MRSYGRPRVLCCNGDADVLAQCERVLTLAGYELSLADDVSQAKAAARRAAHDVMVLDLDTAVDGLAVLREVEGDAPCLVTYGADAAVDAAVALLPRGATDFLRKPFDDEALVTRVDRVLASTHVRADGALLAVTQSIFSSLDATQIVRRVLEVVRALLDADSAALFMSEVAEVAEGAEAAPVAASRPTPTVARLLELRDPCVLDASIAADLPAIEALAPGSATMLVQRLSVGDRVLGLLCAGRALGRRGFADADMRRAMLLAGHVALALDNARLHAATEDQARRLEQALDRLVVAERAAMLARLASGLGHEISNPASAALIHLELAKDALARGRLADVAQAIDRAAAGANAVIDVARALRPLSGARLPGVVDLRAVIDGALILCGYQLRGRASVVVDAPAIIPGVAGDQAKLGQVFLNLLINAAQAIPGGAESTNTVRIVVTPAVREVVVRFEDTGPGVAAALVPRLFQPSVTTKTSGSGHGMGLAVCRWVLEEMGGTIRYAPNQPHGAVFELRLPREGKD